MKKTIALLISVLLILTSMSVYKLIDIDSDFTASADESPIGDNETNPFYVYEYHNYTGGMSRWVLNDSYIKEFLKDNMRWRLQASPDNNTWYDADSLLDIDLVWNESDYSYKVTLTLNTTDAPVDLYYRFDLACNVSLKDYLVNSSISFWQMRIPTNTDRDIFIFFNWSDIKPLVQSGKVWYDYGRKEVNDKEFFWFRIQSVNKVPVGVVFVVDPTYGMIADSVVDSFEFEPSRGSMADMVRVGDSNYYLTTWFDASVKTWARTLYVYPNNGTIAGNVSSLRLVNGYSTYGYIYKTPHAVNGNEYIYVAGGYWGGSVAAVKTIRVWSNNGTVDAVIDTQNLNYPSSYTVITHLDGGVYAVPYFAGGGAEGRACIETIYVDPLGQISGINDTSFFNVTKNGAWSIDAVALDSDTIAIVYDGYSGGGNDGYVCTANISSAGIISGDIGGNKSDEWEFDPFYCSRVTITPISGNVYAITYLGYCGVAYDGWVVTLSISDNGMITKSFIDTLNYETSTQGTFGRTTNLADDLYAITYVEDTSDDGWVKTLNISDAGDIDSVIDSLEFDGSDSLGYAPLAEVGNDFYLIVYEGTDNDGWSCTVNITTPEAPTNNAPTIGCVYPTNTSTGLSLNPKLWIYVNDSDGSDTLNVMWQENTSGSWVTMQNNNSLSGGTNSLNCTPSKFGTELTKYWWKIYADDGTDNVSAIYEFTTMENWSNTAPTQSNPQPNATIDIDINPYLNITVNDIDADTMDVTKRTNASGIWTSVFWLNNTLNTTMSNLTSDIFTEYGKKYWWSVNLTDSTNWTNATYSFTTKLINTSINIITPYEQTTSPLSINATGDSNLDNVTLWYRYSSDNITWEENHTNWYTYGKNQTREGYTTCNYAPINNTLLWTANTTSSYDAYSGAIVVDGIVYISGKNTSSGIGNNKTYALYLNNGTEIWNFTTYTVDATPTYSRENNLLFVQGDGRLAVDSLDNTNLWCLYPNNGTMKWKFSTYGRNHGYSTSPALDVENNLVITASNGNIWGIYQNNGTMKWNNTIGNVSGIVVGGAITYYNHSILGGVVIRSNHADGASCYYSNNGTLIWYNTTSEYDGWDTASICELIDGQEVVFFAKCLGNYITINCANISTSKSIWSWSILAVAVATTTAISYHDEKLYFGGINQTLYCINATIDDPPVERLIWANDLGGMIYGQPAISNGFIYVGAKEAKMVYCLYESNGTEVWNYTLGDITFGQPCISDGILLIGCDDWNLYAFGDLEEYNQTGEQWISWNDDSNPDSVYPWQWNFTFPNSTGYYEFYSIGKKSGSDDEITPIIKDAMCHYTASLAIDASVSPNSWIEGNIAVGTDIQENFTFYQNGTATVDILVGVDSTNLTFVNYTSWLSLGHDRYCANFTVDNWSSESMIQPGYPGTTTLKSGFAPGNFSFGIRIWMPRTVSYQSRREDYQIILTVSVAT